MNKKLSILIIITSVQQSFFHAQESTKEQKLSALLDTKLNTTAPIQTANEPLIYFNLHDEKLFDVVNRLAAQKQINIILPTDSKKLMETSVNFRVPYKITLARAWQMLVNMLDIAGFSVIPDQNLYTLVAKSTINQKVAPLYIDYSTDMLPSTNEVIRYIYYFHNLSLKDKGTKDNLQKIIADLVVPMDTEQSQQNFSLDETFNILLITAPANIIKSTMPIIRELDQNGFRESIEVVPLFYSTAKEITDVLNQLIPKDKSQEDMFRFPAVAAGAGKTAHSFFSSSTRIVSIDASNSVAIFGSQDSVERVKKIVKNNLDTKIDAEKTVLHLKRIRYLNAEELADTLTKLVEQRDADAQSTGAVSLAKLLSNVIIVAEKEQVIEKTKKQQKESAAPQDEGSIGVTSVKEAAEGEGAIVGGNNLIVACTQRDWKILEKMIDVIDTEQSQIALEVLILDISVETSNLLTSQMRRIMNDQMQQDLKWQSAMAAAPILNYTDLAGEGTINKPIGIEPDLLSEQPATTAVPFASDVAYNQPVGSTVFAFKDNNGVALVLSLLQSFKDVKVLSKPFLIARNNEPAIVLSKQLQYVPGPIENQSKGGTVVVKYVPMVAALQVKITPRISMPPDNINLDISVDANDFLEATVVLHRTIRTNANISPKEILVLGGISQASLSDQTNRVPILGSIPIIGNLFRKQSLSNNQRNLVVFIAPKQIPPASARLGTDRFTSKLLKKATSIMEFDDANFSTLRDPVSNFLFDPKENKKMAKTMQDYRYAWKEPPAKKKKTTQPMQASPKKKDKLKQLLTTEKNPFKN